MRQISDKPETGKDEFEERIVLNRAHPIYQGFKLLRSTLAQAGFKDHWNTVAAGFLFVCDGDLKNSYYKKWRSIDRGMLKELEGVSITNKQYDECCRQVLEKIESGELNFLNGTN